MKKLKNYLPMIINILAILIPFLFTVFLAFKGLGDWFSPPIRFSLSGLLALGYFVFAIGFHTIAHEFGHLVTGLMSGYKYLFFRIWKYALVKKGGKFSIKHFHIPGSLGQCLMAPPEKVNGDFPFLLYNLGGIIINGLLALVFLGGFSLVDFSWLSSLFFALFFVGVYLAFTNAYPFPGLPNDGSNIKSLLKSKDSKVAFYNALQMLALTVLENPTRDQMKALVDRRLFSNFSDPLVQGVVSENIGLYIEEGNFYEALKFSDFLLGQKNMNIMVRNMIRMDRAALYLLLSNKEGVENLFQIKDFTNFIKGNQADNHRLYYMYYALFENNQTKASERLSAYNKAAAKALMESDTKFDRLLIDLTKKRLEDLENVEESYENRQDFSKKILMVNKEAKIIHIKYKLGDKFRDEDFLKAFSFIKEAVKKGLNKDLYYLYPGYIFSNDKLVGEIIGRDSTIEIKVQLQGVYPSGRDDFVSGSLNVVKAARSRAYISYYLVKNILENKPLEEKNYRKNIFKRDEDVFVKVSYENIDRLVFGRFLGYNRDFSIRLKTVEGEISLDKRAELISDYKVKPLLLEKK